MVALTLFIAQYFARDTEREGGAWTRCGVDGLRILIVRGLVRLPFTSRRSCHRCNNSPSAIAVPVAPAAIVGARAVVRTYEREPLYADRVQGSAK